MPENRYRPPPGNALARAYEPTFRDQAANALLRVIGDDQPQRQLVRNLLGSAGAGYTGRNALADWTPLGVPFALEEAGRNIGTPGQRGVGVVDAALAALPIPAAGKKVTRRVAKHVPFIDKLSRGEIPTPTPEQMASLGRLERVPLDRARSTQNVRDWDSFEARSSTPLIDGYGDHPVAVRMNNGEFWLFDGHHRSDMAYSRGDSDLPMWVIDASAYAPRFAGKPPAPQPSRAEIDELLRDLLGE